MSDLFLFLEPDSSAVVCISVATERQLNVWHRNHLRLFVSLELSVMQLSSGSSLKQQQQTMLTEKNAQCVLIFTRTQQIMFCTLNPI